MSRSGYSDDGDYLELYRQSVECSLLGKRGQALLKRLRDALDAMPVKQLIRGDFVTPTGAVCALGAVDPTFNPRDPEDWDAVAAHFNIAPSMAREIMYLNDEWDEYRREPETAEQRWTRMREWVAKQIGPDDDATGEPVGELRVDPVGGN